MHCAAGDGIGIIAGAVIVSFLSIPGLLEFGLEYILGFGFGWAFFQAYAMKEMAGGSYAKSLSMSFLPEFLSMNLLMTGMVLTMSVLKPAIDGSRDPFRPEFWFVISIALIAGFIFAYPMNWWLVSNGMKHGMITVRDRNIYNNDPNEGMKTEHHEHGHSGTGSKPPTSEIVKIAFFSILCLIAGIFIFQRIF